MGDRVRYRFALWRAQPNPLWMREMRQSTRQTRTPVILTVLTVLCTLLMTTIGSGLSSSSSPAESGNILFHVFFSLAFFVVTLVGPALAANSIASEREGKTWEAVLLTGVRPAEIARGKFLAAYTAIGMYVVALAPVGALPFLFGGITPLEVIVAFAFLFIIALLSVAFGLAISSKMNTLRSALLITLLLAIPASVFVYFVGGVALSFAAPEAWPSVAGGAPVWLPTAYGRADFGIPYVVFLVIIPTAALTLPAWFLYEITTANLSGATDDRAYGLKRWYLVTTPVIIACAVIPVLTAVGNPVEVTAASAALVTPYLIFCAFVFMGDALGPSRRVRVLLEGAKPVRRFLGPGVDKGTVLQLGATIVAMGALAVVGVASIDSSLPKAATHTHQILLFCTYCASFVVFSLGLGAQLRTRSPNASGPRVLLLVVIFALLALPWIIAAIAGVFHRSGPSSASLAIASPSPIYLLLALEALDKGESIPVTAAYLCSAIYAASGLALFAIAKRRCSKVTAEYEQIYREADRRLAEEDAAATKSKEEGDGDDSAAALAELERPAPVDGAAHTTSNEGSADELDGADDAHSTDDSTVAPSDESEHPSTEPRSSESPPDDEAPA